MRLLTHVVHADNIRDQGISWCPENVPRNTSKTFAPKSFEASAETGAGAESGSHLACNRGRKRKIIRNKTEICATEIWEIIKQKLWNNVIEFLNNIILKMGVADLSTNAHELHVP
jgi:hypothetical protein